MRCLLVAVLLSASATLPAQAQAPPILSAPAEVAGFVRTDSTVFPDPALGRAFRYEAGPQRYDVYVYPLGAADAARTSAEILAIQAQAYLDGLPIGVQRGWYENFNIAFNNEHDVQVAEQVVPGRFASAALRVRGGAHVTFFYVFLLADQLVKVRTTFPAERLGEMSPNEFNAPLLDALLRSATPSATPSSPRPPPPIGPVG